MLSKGTSTLVVIFLGNKIIVIMIIVVNALRSHYEKDTSILVLYIIL